MSELRGLSAVAVPGLPEVAEGDDLPAQIVAACTACGIELTGEDVVVVASKVVAKAEGRTLTGTDRAEAITSQTVRVVAARTMPDGGLTQVVQSRSGPVLVAAGVDASDVPRGTVLLLPADPDASARTLRAGIRRLTGTAPAVLVSDTAGRPWRDGVTDFALGAAGLACLDDARGRLDRFGRTLEVTVRGIGDEVAALADLVKGKAAGLPVAVVRGLGDYITEADGAGAGPCVRTGPTDWFRFGQVEAVRASLGLADGEIAPPPLVPSSEDDAARLARAVAVATAGSAPSAVTMDVKEDQVVVHGDPVLAGVMAQRLMAACWSEGVAAALVVDDLVRVVVYPREASQASNSSGGIGRAK